jgi:RimJ/RimL family protein N-acetyltransferase
MDMGSNGLADYPAELEGYVTLPNRTRLRIRPLRRCEDGPVRDLFAHLSLNTRYLRFFSGMPKLPDAVLRLLIAVDYRRRLALVAQRDDADGGEVVGLGSFGAIDDTTAEVALVIRDDWQRQRVGTELAKRVLQAAEARGFDRFVAHVLSGNDAIRRVLKHMGVVRSATISGGVTEFVFVRRPTP